ncbi:MAG: proteasome assembly chaperone family protein [Candidatus Omnitrophica bacterium]|nr:proteasome assembly chaperone family protein [Candidatus Omnitrophota bacterium]
MIKEVNTPKLKNPIFIAVWPGMGEVAYRCALFLREVMGFKMFAKLEAGHFFKPAAVTVEKGVVSLPSVPAGFFYYVKGKKFPDIILFLGEAQPPLEHAEEFSEAIVDFVKKYKAKFILTFAAKPEPIDHKIEPAVWIVATHKEVFKDFENIKLKVLKEGQISGLNGIILGVGKRKRMKGACLLGEIPFYTVQIENPKATTNILRVVNKFLKCNLNLSPLIERSKFIEEEIEKLINYLKGEEEPPSGNSPLSEEDIAKIKNDLAAYTKLPQSAREKIEKSFQDAQRDITDANKLKAELDRWNVYKEYEDRFLDLFKRKDTKEETQ